MLQFEYIRAIETSTREEDPASALAPIPAEPTAEPEPEATLDQLVAHARDEVGVDPHADLATPPPLRFQLPSFLGVPLAYAPVEPERDLGVADDVDRTTNETARASGLTRGLMAVLGPGMLTMSLAVAATVAFGAFVVTR